MTLMQKSKRRVRFGKLPIGAYFQWQEEPIYHKVGLEHAIREAPEYYRKLYVFADKCLVYRMIFTREDR